VAVPPVVALFWAQGISFGEAWAPLRDWPPVGLLCAPTSRLELLVKTLLVVLVLVLLLELVLVAVFVIASLVMLLTLEVGSWLVVWLAIIVVVPIPEGLVTKVLLTSVEPVLELCGQGGKASRLSVVRNSSAVAYPSSELSTAGRMVDPRLGVTIFTMMGPCFGLISKGRRSFFARQGAGSGVEKPDVLPCALVGPNLLRKRRKMTL